MHTSIGVAWCQRLILVNKVKIKTILPCLLLLAYYLDFKFQIFIPILCLSAIVLFLGAKYDLPQHLSIKSNLKLIRALLILFPLYILIIQLARIKVGAEGVDFAIFSQAVLNFSKGLGLQTSLIDYGWQNLLTHHFSPYLYLPGLINKIWNAPEVILVLFHVLAVSSSLIFAHLIIREKHPLLISYLGLTLIILLPAVRISLLWEVRDEIYALPFLLGAYYALNKNKDCLSILLLAISCCFKETMFLVSAGFCLKVIISNYRQVPEIRRNSLAWIVFGAITSLSFFLYTIILPNHIFLSTFSADARIASPNDLFSADFILQKSKWIVFTFTPLIPLLVFMFRKRSRLPQVTNLLIEALPVIPLVFAIIISNFQPMFNPFCYYSVVPIFYLTVVILKNLNSGRHKKLSRLLTLSILLACLVGHQTYAIQDLNQAITRPSPYLEINQQVPQTSIVFTDKYERNFSTQNEKLTRVYQANNNHLKFDY